MTPDTIRRRTPGPTCSLCGDCIGACNDRQIGYQLPGLSSRAARQIFFVIMAVIHALFLGFGRI